MTLQVDDYCETDDDIFTNFKSCHSELCSGKTESSNNFVMIVIALFIWKLSSSHLYHLALSTVTRVESFNVDANNILEAVPVAGLTAASTT